MNLSDLKESKFLKRSDVGSGVMVTISALTQENVAKEGAEPEMKYCLHFKESAKPMVLNSTNGQIIGKITGITDNIDTGWIGKQIILYDDPNVSFGGELVGGIRVRSAQKQPVNKAVVNNVGDPGPDPTQAPNEGDLPWLT